MTRVALYARYSSDNQRDASIEDQLRQCRERAAREGSTGSNAQANPVKAPARHRLIPIVGLGQNPRLSRPSTSS